LSRHWIFIIIGVCIIFSSYIISFEDVPVAGKSDLLPNAELLFELVVAESSAIGEALFAWNFCLNSANR
jgi:hypothetical protein